MYRRTLVFVLTQLDSIQFAKCSIIQDGIRQDTQLSVISRVMFFEETEGVELRLQMIQKYHVMESKILKSIL